MNQKPLGLVVLGVMAGLGGMVMALLLLGLDRGSGVDFVLVRGGAAALAVASFVAAEALVRVRPWFWHASLGLALTWCLVLVCAAIGTAGLGGIGVGLVFVGVSFVVLLPMLVYIRDEWMRMRRAASRVPTPPRPWPVPGRGP